MISPAKFAELGDIIRDNTDFVITTHVNPDGDGLGSELAIFHLLRKLGKNAIIINDSPTPSFFKFLDPDNSKIHYYDQSYDERIKFCDAVIILDISIIERLGRMQDIVRQSSAVSVCIDHHVSNSGWSEVNLIDEDTSASGEIVFDLIKSMGVDIDRVIALCLYIAILTDTGSFRFSNTTGRTHQICGELLNKGLNPHEIYADVYESYSWERMLLFSKALPTIRKVAGGKASSILITNEMMESTGAKREDIEGFVEYLTTVKDVEIAVLFLELPDNKIKVSLRSKDVHDVNKLASLFGGGGHINAAGILLEDYTLQRAEEELLAAVEKVF